MSTPSDLRFIQGSPSRTVITRGLVAAIALGSSLGACAQASHLLQGDSSSNAVAERSIYINRRPVGVFSVCTKPGVSHVYLPKAFYRTVMLKRSEESIDCEGTLFVRPRLNFERDDGRLLLSASALPQDYADEAEDDGLQSTSAAEPVKAVPSAPTTATVLQHDLGVWVSSSNRSTNLSASLQALQYSDLGRLEASGSFSVDSGRFRGTFTNLGLQRHIPSWQANLAIGARTVSAAQQSLSLYGVLLESDDIAVGAPLRVERMLEGFADVPGRLSIHAGDVLVREMAIAAGRFSIPVSSLSSVRNNSGDYTLTLYDASGVVVRKWNMFVPFQNNLLRAGDSTWKVFAGQIGRTGLARSRQAIDRSSPGIGVVYQRGLNASTTAEWLGSLAQDTSRFGVSIYHVPSSWLSIAAAAGKVWRRTGDSPPASFTLEADLRGDTFGLGTGISSRGCEADSVMLRKLGRCSSAWVRARANLNALGMVTAFAEQSFGSPRETSSRGIGWDLPAFGRASVSLYANQTISRRGESNYSVGATLTVPFDKGNIRSTVRHSESGSTASATYTAPHGADLSYALGAQTQIGTGNAARQLSGSMQYTPWFGTYGANLQLDKRGGFLGLNESGTLVWAQGQLLVTRAGGEDSLAIIRAAEARGVKVERAGQPQAVTNGNGYAAVFVGRGDQPELKLAASELGEDIKVGTHLVGKVESRWTAALWMPEVRKVNRGWMRLTLASGVAVPPGSLVHLAGAESSTVLDDGEVFIEELPRGATQAQVLLPGNVARCNVTFGGVALSLKSSSLDMPNFVCTPPSKD